jgi:hypothetical protein
MEESKRILDELDVDIEIVAEDGVDEKNKSVPTFFFARRIIIIIIIVEGITNSDDEVGFYSEFGAVLAADGETSRITTNFEDVRRTRVSLHDAREQGKKVDSGERGSIPFAFGETIQVASEM